LKTKHPVRFAGICIYSVCAALILQSCDGKCIKSADLTMPPYINGTVKVADETINTFIGSINYPFGTGVYLINSVNEFYSVVRKNPFTNTPVIFYWNINTPPPFFVNAPPPNNPLQVGETVNIHRCVFNNNFDMDCFFKKAEPSKTEMKMVVKVENGVIVDSQVKEAETPELAPGAYEVLTFPVQVNALGSFEFSFTVNADHSASESDTSNNIFITRPTDDLGAGGH